jgi:hypothetical protein
MSWSVSAIGKAPAVARSIADQITNGSKCLEPEESVRQAAAALIKAALVAQDTAGVVVQVIASGSMGYKDWTAKTGVYNSLNIQIVPQHGFIE